MNSIVRSDCKSRTQFFSEEVTQILDTVSKIAAHLFNAVSFQVYAIWTINKLLIACSVFFLYNLETQSWVL